MPIWGQNCGGEQMDHIDQVLDLNMEAVVEGDDDALLLQNQILMDLNLGIVDQDPAEIIDLNAPPSMEMNSSDVSTSDLESVDVASDGVEGMQLSLVLQASPVNFRVEELQPEDLMSNEQIQAQILEGSIPSDENNAARNNIMQVGMALLPDNLNVDPGLSAIAPFQGSAKKRSTEGVRLWATYFAPGGSDECVQVPFGWEIFFIASLLNPTCFDWTKNFLSSEAWNVIISDAFDEPSISFTIPHKCPSKRKLECTISEIEEEVVLEPQASHKTVISEHRDTSFPTEA
jgi:hypothetical protein